MKVKSVKWYKRECQKLWAENIKKQFNSKCWVCNGQKCLNAHHLFSKKAHPSTRYDIENGILLCYYHHRKAHEADPDTIIKMLSRFETDQYERLRTRAKSGSCKHNYEKIYEDLSENN